MIKFEKTQASGFDAAIRGMRNPLNSWALSDSFECEHYEEFSDWCDVCEYEGCKYLAVEKDGKWLTAKCTAEHKFVIGEEDLKLMHRLALLGDDHGKFARFINVTADITAPTYWWLEFDTYKVGTVSNSCSKMHKLLEKPFTVEDFSFDKTAGYKKEVSQFRPDVDEFSELWACYADDYWVSNQGRIRNGQRVLSGSLHKDGYIFVTIHGKQRPLHRLVAEKWCENYSDKLEVNHKDGNKLNNRADNLEWVTRAENQKHAVDMGLQPKNVKTYKGKFSHDERERIKKEWDSGEISKRKLADKYGVSHTCICDIINDKYKYADKTNVYEDAARPIVDTLNELRDSWLGCETNEGKKKIWYTIIQLLPTSYNQKRTVQLNYQVLNRIVKARKNHKLDEWHVFCDWALNLPYFEAIYGDK